MNTVTSGQTVNLHYVGTFLDGSEFDNSRKRDTPLKCEVGSGALIKGFDNQIMGMSVGETKQFTLNPDEAYGDIIPEAFQTVPRHRFPESFSFKVGHLVEGKGPNGELIKAKIESVEEENIILNFNHPLAGKTLNFEVEILSVE